jgi:predicted Zn-dependent protease
MQKILLQFILIAGLFLGIWQGISQFDFVGELEIEKISTNNEKKFGELIIKQIKSSKDYVNNDSLYIIVNSIKDRICNSNKIKGKTIKIHIIESNEINAFALPNRNLVIYSQLIVDSKNPEELAGVMAHEIAHMEQGHVMKKVVKEIGLSLLATIIGGNSGGEILKEATQTLSSKAYDRSLETEADAMAVKYLVNANIDPVNFSTFLFRLSTTENDMPSAFNWINTHPESKERVAEVLKLKKKYTFNVKPLLSASIWNRAKVLLETKKEDDKTFQQ